jgi:hypothetical protein
VTGTWTEGPLAMLRMGLAAPDRARSLTLEMEALPFLERHPQLDVDLVINGQTVDRWIFRSGAPVARQRARIPAALVGGRDGLDIELRFRNPGSPLTPGVAAPGSFLGLHVRSLVVGPE